MEMRSRDHPRGFLRNSRGTPGTRSTNPPLEATRVFLAPNPKATVPVPVPSRNSHLKLSDPSEQHSTARKVALQARCAAAMASGAGQFVPGPSHGLLSATRRGTPLKTWVLSALLGVAAVSLLVSCAWLLTGNSDSATVLYTNPHAEVAPFQRVWNPDTNNAYTIDEFAGDDKEDDIRKPHHGRESREVTSSMDLPQVLPYAGAAGSVGQVAVNEEQDQSPRRCQC
eukprot:1512196-Rhodomonas_salina.2